MTETTKTIKVLGLLFSGFITGFAASQFLSKDSIFSGSQEVAGCDTDNWQQLARTSDWMPRDECPAYPLRLAITSPGDQTYVSQKRDRASAIEERVVVTLSRPLPDGMRVYLAAQEVGSTNLYVSKENLFLNRDRVVAATTGWSDLGFNFSKESGIKLWAFATDSDDEVGDLYTSVQQLQNGVRDVYVSESIQLSVYVPTKDE